MPSARKRPQKWLLKLLLLTLLLLSQASAQPNRPLALISLNAEIHYQTMSGWEATAQAGQIDSAAFPNYADSLFDRAVNELGINRLRVEIVAATENSVDYWSQFQAGQLSESAWNKLSASTVNDNADPNVINWDGFHFKQLDSVIDTVVLPVQQRLEARGEKLMLNVCYVAFTSLTEPGHEYHHANPQEYAEFVLATYLHLQEKYGFVPDTWEVILEPDNTREWDGTRIGQAIAATARVLQAHGFTPRFIAPSTANMTSAIGYFDKLMAVPGVQPYVVELSYHRYNGVSASSLAALAERAVRYGINTAMLEHINSPYPTLFEDLTLGRNSAWQEYTLAYSGNDQGGKYFLIDDHRPNSPTITLSHHARYFRQVFLYVRAGAVRIDATSTQPDVVPLAFVNANGRYVVVFATDGNQPFSIQGLPSGVYGLEYSTDEAAPVELADVAIGNGEPLSATLPRSGLITIYQKESDPNPVVTPTVPASPPPTLAEPTFMPSPAPRVTHSPVPPVFTASAGPVETSRTPVRASPPVNQPPDDVVSNPDDAGRARLYLALGLAVSALGMLIFLAWLYTYWRERR